MPITINGSTGIAGVDGSASTPAIQGTDTNTGVTFPAADTVAVSTGGNERMRVDSSGNVGIGTSSPVTSLGGGLTLGSTTSGKNLSVYSSDNGSNGIIRIFSSSGTEEGQVYAGAGTLTAYANSVLRLSTNGSERARFTSGGELFVGTTSQIGAGKFCVSFDANTYQGIALKETAYGSGSTFILFRNLSDSTVGSIAQNGTSAVSYNTSSDYRLKENIQPMQNALAKIALLNPVTYTWKTDGSDGQGFIAHELQAVVPDCVTGEKDAVDKDGNPIYQGVDTSFLVATLTKAIQELNAKVEGLQAEINALKGAA